MPFYNPMFPLIAIKSLVTLNVAINLCYFHVWHTIFQFMFYFNFGILSSLIMPFMSHLINYDFTLVLGPHSEFINLSFHNFILNNNSKKTNYNCTWCTYAPLQLHVLYTLSGWGVTNPPSLEHFVLEINKLNSKERKIPHSENN